MKKLVMSALMFGALAQAAGCIFVSDDGSSGGNTANVNAVWSLVNDTAASGCPAGATTATVYSQRIGIDATPFTDNYNCGDLSGAAADLPISDTVNGDTYTVWVDITDTSGANLYAESESVDIPLHVGDNATANFTIDVANGFFDVAWMLNGNTCAALPNTHVVATLTSTQAANDDIFTCSDGEATSTTDSIRVTTPAEPIGDQVVVIDTESGDGQTFLQSQPINTTIDHGNQYVDLGVVQLN